MTRRVAIIAGGSRAVPGKSGCDLANLAREYRSVVRVLWDALSDVLEEAEFPTRLDSRLRGDALRAIARAERLAERDPSVRR